jgi:hypothetical protein
MKMKKNIFIIVALAVVALTGCDFLDHEPDMRAEINTKEKVQLLLVSAYTYANSAPICEYSSDNVIDNNVPDPKTGQANAVNPLDEMYNEIFAWKPVKSSGSQDSPKYIWDGHYTAIATANQALEAIQKLEAQGINMNAEKGEALLSRAYHHFLLAGVFCQAWKNAEDSKKDLGLTYMMQPETKVAPKYSRGPELVINIDEYGDTAWIGGSLYHTFEQIQKDLEAGLKLVSDEYYTIPRYHFNIKAAHAFAARFYLYKREWAKVVEHADYVLTTSDESTLAMLYDAQTGRDASNIELAYKHYIDVQAPSNLLLHTSYSSSAYAHFPSYGRYQYNGEAQDFTTYGSGPCWGGQFPGFGTWSADQKLGGFCAKDYYDFEYTDKVAGYGYIRMVTRAFTTNETLLCRAEAKTYLNDFAGAANDFRMWAQGYNVSGRMNMNADSTVKLTPEIITKFYTEKAGTKFAPELNNQNMDPTWTITAEQMPFVHCAIHFRRIETLHDGLRWQDIKRYGIEIEHVQGKDAPRKLVWNDDRRAIQLPQEVIVSGMTANPREVMGDNLDGNMTTSPSFNPNDVYTPSEPTYTSAASLPSSSSLKLVEDEE